MENPSVQAISGTASAEDPDFEPGNPVRVLAAIVVSNQAATHGTVASSMNRPPAGRRHTRCARPIAHLRRATWRHSPTNLSAGVTV